MATVEVYELSENTKSVFCEKCSSYVLLDQAYKANEESRTVYSHFCGQVLGFRTVKASVEPKREVQFEFESPFVDLSRVKTAVPYPELGQQTAIESFGKPIAEKYRPYFLDDLLGNEKIIATLEGMVQRNDLPYVILFWGSPGIGKTSAARSFANSYFRNFGVYDKEGNFEATIGRGFDPQIFYDRPIRVGDVNGRIREMFRNLAPISETGIPLRKLLVFDEADKTSREALLELRSLLEKYSETTTVIMTSNEDPQNWLDPKDVSLRGVASRIRVFHFEAPSTEEVSKRISVIAASEKIDATPEEIDQLIRDSTIEGELDIRKAIDNLESLASLKEGMKIRAERKNCE